MSGFVVVAIALAAAAALARLEVRRPNRRRLALRLAATAAALAALTALALRPTRLVRAAGERAVLVTEGSSARDGARVADSVGAARVALTFDSLPEGLRELFVVGWGLDSLELARLDTVTVHYVPARLPPGLTHAHWPARITLGQEAELKGRASPAGGWVHVAGPGFRRDSARTSSDGTFSLRVLPRVRGLARLTLRSAGTTDTASMDVAAPRILRLLVIEAAPSFETSRLRDWTSRRGGTVVIRTRVSAGRWRTERVNAATGALAPLSSELLRRFDVVLTDPTALGVLASAERSALREAIDADGLGMLVLPGRARAVPAPGPAPAFTVTELGGGPRIVRVLASGSRRPEPPVPVAPTFLRDTFGVATMVRDERGRAVAQWRPAGAGRVATTLVSSPSRWLLEGERDAYDRYWAQILGTVARPAARWSLDGTGFSRSDEPILVIREGERLGRAVVLRPDGGTDTLTLTTDSNEARSSGVYWPRRAGKYLVAANGDSAEFDVRGANSWVTARAAARQEATRRWVSVRGEGVLPIATASAAVPLPQWWFFCLFLAAAGFLWWERRAAGS